MNKSIIIGGVVLVAVVLLAASRSSSGRSYFTRTSGSTPIDPSAMQLQQTFIQSTLEDRKDYRASLLKSEEQKNQFVLGKRGLRLQRALAEIGLERVKAEEQTKQMLGRYALESRKAELSAQKRGGLFGFLSDIGSTIAGLF